MIRRVFAGAGQVALFLLGGDRAMRRFVHKALDAQGSARYAQHPERERRFGL